MTNNELNLLVGLRLDDKNAKQQLAEMDADQDVAIIGPKNNTVALISSLNPTSEIVLTLQVPNICFPFL